MGQNKTLIIRMPLITHIAYTQNKTKADKKMKINGQTIYNGSLNKFKRAIVVENMHYYFNYNIPYEYLNLNLEKVESVNYIFHTVINHGSITMRNGIIYWKPAKSDYVPNWDIKNLRDIWEKTGDDSLVLSKVISDDNVGVLSKGSYEFREVKHIDDLELEVIINY